MKDVFKEYKSDLEKCILNEPEQGHMDADDILIMIARDAASQLLTLKEVNALIKLYDEVRKWYA